MFSRYAIVLAIVAIVWILFSVMWSSRLTISDGSDVQRPISWIEFNVELRARQKFFAAMKKFASKNAFAIRIAQTKPGDTSYLIQLFREDVKIIAVNAPEEYLFRIGFYNNYRSTTRDNEAAVDFLVKDLKKNMEALAGVSLDSSLAGARK